MNVGDCQLATALRNNESESKHACDTEPDPPNVIHHIIELVEFVLD